MKAIYFRHFCNQQLLQSALYLRAKYAFLVRQKRVRLAGLLHEIEEVLQARGLRCVEDGGCALLGDLAAIKKQNLVSSTAGKAELVCDE